jgi:hypothetical protein
MNRFLIPFSIPMTLLLLALHPMIAAATAAPGMGRGPSPALSPEAVVRIQVEALRDNGDDDAGIAEVFRFASPGNRSQTGPLPRFVRMVRAAPYDALLNHRRASYGPVALGQERMQQTVTVTASDGSERRFLWLVSRQSEGEHSGCWMTDAVIPIEVEDADRPVWPSRPVT